MICLVNLINNPEYKDVIAEMQGHLRMQMQKTEDPMLKAFQNRDDRAKVDAVLEATYGKPKDKKKGTKGYDPRA